MTSFTVVPLLTVRLGASAGESAAGRIEVPSVLVQLIEQVDVPAQAAGVLTDVKTQEGRMVKQGDLLAQVMDVEARHKETQAKTELDIARLNAENDINVRFAKKSAEVAKAELQRALKSIERFPSSISGSEIDRLKLTVERAVLEIEQAERDFLIAAQTQRVKEDALKLASHQVQRYKIVAPLDGVVAAVNRSRGEWVDAKDAVLRILRMDRLRAEGFLKAKDLRRDLQGCQITLTVDLPDGAGARFSGRITFVSPEIDPVNLQVRVWADVENVGLRLRPGMRARMSIESAPPDSTAKP